MVRLYFESVGIGVAEVITRFRFPGGYKAVNEKQESPFGFRGNTRGSRGTKKSFLRNLTQERFLVGGFFDWQSAPEFEMGRRGFNDLMST